MKFSLNTKLLLSVSSLLVTIASNDMARGSDDGDMNHRVRQRAEDPQDPFLPDESTSKRAKNRKAPAEPAADVADEIVAMDNADAGNAKKRGRGDEDDAQTLTNQDQNPAVLKNAKAEIVDDQLMAAEDVQQFLFQRLQKEYYEPEQDWALVKLCDLPERKAELQEVLSGFSQSKLNRLVTWIENELDIKEIDKFIKLLNIFKDLPADRLEQSIKWLPEFLDVDADTLPRNEDKVAVIQFILGCSEHQLPIVRDWIVELGAQPVIQKGAEDAIKLLTFAKEAPDYTLKRIAVWNKKANVFGRCQYASSMNEVLDRIQYCSDFVMNAVAEFLTYLPAGYLEGVDYFKSNGDEEEGSGNEITMLMDLLARESNVKRITAALQWMRDFKQQTGFVLSEQEFVDAMPNPYLAPLVELLLTTEEKGVGIEDDDHFLNDYPSFISQFGIHNKSSKISFENISDLLSLAISGDFGDISSTTKRLQAMQSSGLLDMCQTVGDVSRALSLLNGPVEATLELFTQFNMRETCKTIDEVLCKLHMYDVQGIVLAPQVVTMGEGQRIFGLYDQAVANPEKRQILDFLPGFLEKVSGPLGANCTRMDVLEFVLTSGALDMCSSASQLKSLIDLRQQGHSLASLTRVLQWAKLKDVKIMADDHIELFKVMLDPKDWVQSLSQSIHKWTRLLTKRGLMDRSFVENILLNANEKGYDAAKSILEQDGRFSLGGPMGIQNSFALYLLSHAHYRPNPAVSTFIEESIAHPGKRVSTLNSVAGLLGQDHPFTQQCLMLALGYDNQHDADGFLAIHQEMMRKRDEAVVHPVYTQTEGCELNLNLVKEPRPARTIHMPLNVWNRLFEQAKAMDQVELQGLIGDSSADNLWALQGEQVITDLLDPLDSLQATRGVSGYSQMLRAVLKNIQDTGNIHTFIQLLVNIQTCITGKLNGIMHSHMFIAEDRVLDEGEIGTEAFKTNILDFFKEDLRRFREVCISHVVKALTRGRDPHDIYFVRGIIGGEVGLFLPNENPVVDFNAYVVKPALRAKTKQELLNLFYGYYSVEEVINRVHTKLNNGSIKVADANLGSNLTAKVIGAYLQDDAMDEDLEGYNQALVTADAEGKPSGLTPKAAEMLLKQLGILVERAPAKVYADPYELLFGE